MNNKIIKLGITGIIVYLLFVISAYAGPNVTLNLTHNWENTNWLALLFSPITDLTGNLGYIILIVVVIGTIYSKQRNTMAFILAAVIVLGVMVEFVPVEWYPYAAILIAIAIGAIFYRMVYRND